MKRICFVFVCVFAFASNIIYAQTLMKEPVIQLKGVKYVYAEDKSSDVVISNYLVNSSPLTLMEVYATQTEKIRSIMDRHMKTLQNCAFKKPMIYGEKEVGSLYQCSYEKNEVLLYNFGQKYYVISSESGETISIFTRTVTPLLCQLYDSKKCTSMYY